MTQRTPQPPIAGVRLAVALLTCSVLLGGGAPLPMAGNSADRVADAQVAPPGASPPPIKSPTPAPIKSPVPATATPTPASPINQAGGPTAPTPTPRPNCDPNGHDCPGGGGKATCDFDGDGKGDLAVGVPGEDANRGAVNIQYGKVGLINTPGLTKPQHPLGNAVLEEAYFGAVLACGDFNGDGIGDLAVGAPHTPVGGSVWFYWGTPGGGLVPNNYWETHQNGGIIPGSPQGSFGHSLAVGDFNRDGVDDLAVGDPLEIKPGTAHQTGTVLVIPGKAGGMDFLGIQQLWPWDVVDGDTDDWFGWSLAAGPMVEGGGDDLAVGSPLTGWPSSYGQAGRVYVFRDHGGLVPYQHIDQAALAAAGLPIPDIGEAEADTWFGYSLAKGDFNGDGKLDLAIGIPQKPVFGKRSGAAVLVPGNGVGFDLSNECYTWQEQVGGSSEKDEMYGWSVAAGNWNVDQYDDLAVGNPYEDVGPAGSIAYRAGAVYVHYGGPTLLGGSGLVLRQGSGLTPGTPQGHEWFGLSLATARLGPNNFEFLLIGIPGEPMNKPSPDCNKAGAIQMAMSWPGAGPVPDASFLLHQDTGAPYNVADERECISAVTPWIMNFGDPASPSKGGEFFGWAIGS